MQCMRNGLVVVMEMWQVRIPRGVGSKDNLGNEQGSIYFFGCWLSCGEVRDGAKAVKVDGEWWGNDRM